MDITKIDFSDMTGWTGSVSNWLSSIAKGFGSFVGNLTMTQKVIILCMVAGVFVIKQMFKIEKHNAKIRGRS